MECMGHICIFHLQTHGPVTHFVVYDVLVHHPNSQIGR